MPSQLRDLTIIKRKSLCADDLFGFVSFACNQHTVTGPCLLESPMNCRSPITFDMHRRNSVGVLVRNSGEDVCNDLLGIFRARIVARYDNQIGTEDRLSHLWAFVAIAISTSTEDNDEPPGTQLSQIRNAPQQCILRVSEVDKYIKRLASHNALKTPGNCT